MTLGLFVTEVSFWGIFFGSSLVWLPVGYLLSLASVSVAIDFLRMKEQK